MRFQSKYAEKLAIEDFRSRLMDCSYDRRIRKTDSYGVENVHHVFVHPHASKRLRERGATNCDQLLVEWYKDAISNTDLLDAVIIANDCDKFAFHDELTGRVITFSVCTSERTEYGVLIQSVYYLSESRSGLFYVGTSGMQCFSFRKNGELLSGVENIPEFAENTRPLISERA